MTQRTCKHCGDPIARSTCEICDRQPWNCCADCHAEIAHGVVRDQNVHFVSGGDATRDEPSPAWENAVRRFEDRG